MSQENVAIARQAFADYFGADPVQAVEGSVRAAHLIAPDVEIDVSRIYPDAPIVHGLKAWREFVRSLPWHTLKLEPERFFDVDDERVLVFTHVTALGEGSHVPAEMRNAHEFTAPGWDIGPLEDLRRPSRSTRSRRAAGVGEVQRACRVSPLRGLGELDPPSPCQIARAVDPCIDPEVLRTKKNPRFAGAFSRGTATGIRIASPNASPAK
jgi:hypothetical protein